MRTLCVLAAAWLAATVWGFSWFARYASRPGSPGKPKERSGSGRWELVYAVHPKCACTRGGLRVLADLTRRQGARLSTTILVRRLGDGTWTLPAAIANARIVEDPDGRQARELGLATSGHAVLYSPDGRVAFSGGLTGIRGSELPGEGAAAVSSLIESRAASVRQPVFGCALFSPSEATP